MRDAILRPLPQLFREPRFHRRSRLHVPRNARRELLSVQSIMGRRTRSALTPSFHLVHLRSVALIATPSRIDGAAQACVGLKGKVVFLTSNVSQ